MIILIILAFAAIALYEMPRLIQGTYWKELVVSSSFLLLAFFMTVLQVLGILKPGLMKGMEYLFKDVLHIYYK